MHEHKFWAWFCCLGVLRGGLGMAQGGGLRIG
jgi:hypothetical protein